jgi:hypothetical protein
MVDVMGQTWHDDHVCDPHMQEAKVGDVLHSEFQTSLGYMARPFLRKRKISK